jgi:SAM-dependent methyltransferase
MSDWARDYFEHGYPQRWALGPPGEETQREADALWAFLRLTPRSQFLDVACGHGKYTLALAQRGATAIGLDLAARLLLRAQHLAAALAVPACWMRGDMRALPVGAESVHAALLIDSFGFFDAEEQNVAVLREVARVLVPEGRLALKVANAAPILASFRRSDREERAGTMVEIERSLLSDPPRLMEEITVSGPGAAGRYQRRQRLYSLAEISATLEAVGLAIVEVLGNLAGGAFRAHESGALVVIAARSPTH